MKLILSILTTSIILIGSNGPVCGQPKDNSSSVSIFANDKTPKPYVVLGQVIAKGTQNENCIKKLQMKALKKGANVIINYQASATGTQGVWSGASVLICQGIVARWSRSGEQGQTSLDPNAPLPVLMN